jgi:hypothetical protein
LLLLLIVATLQIDVRSKSGPVSGATVVVNGATYATALDGSVTVSVEAGVVEVTAVKDGFVSVTATVTVQEDQTQQVVIELHESPVIEEEVTVAATRTDKRLDDQPMRVEVLAREEIEEKMLMTPGDIVMIQADAGNGSTAVGERFSVRRSLDRRSATGRPILQPDDRFSGGRSAKASRSTSGKRLSARS